MLGRGRGGLISLMFYCFGESLIGRFVFYVGFRSTAVKLGDKNKNSSHFSLQILYLSSFWENSHCSDQKCSAVHSLWTFLTFRNLHHFTDSLTLGINDKNVVNCVVFPPPLLHVLCYILICQQQSTTLLLQSWQQQQKLNASSFYPQLTFGAGLVQMCWQASDGDLFHCVSHCSWL